MSDIKFKKKKRSGGNKRLRIEEIVPDEAVAASEQAEVQQLDATEDSELVEEMRLLQQSRKRNRGVNITVGQDDSGTRNATLDLAVDDKGLEEVFTAQHEREDKDAVQEKMEQFIDQQVAEEKKRWQEEARREALAKQKRDAEALYAENAADDAAGTADASGRAFDDAAAAAAKVDGGGGDDDDELAALKRATAQAEEKEQAGTAGWGAGIEEVSLPIEFKIKNIEQTERAKQQWLRDAKQRREHARQASQVVPGNFNLSTAAKTDFHASSGSSSTRRGTGTGGGGGGGGGHHQQSVNGPQATDNLAMARFKKSQTRRK